ncbi:hypothetical protein AZE42_04838 [Rhizopogon vesiculosus]|uniref:Glycoside hydrolase family 31 TIM barrel domain-containing protein n=1 Tax=Rhizopogon vesiculosus TaxID=180088 RepID=A0A1J8QGT4_9AGAM|nr:hypothetical protein AZE42_04838 [Rhizopogon vesiculosus]
MTVIEKRGVGADGENAAIGSLNRNTLATNAIHYGGYAKLDVYNMLGLLEEKTTNLVVQSVLPGKRPFLISRSTFPSAGKWTGHWLGDNYSRWQYMYLNIQGVLQFRIRQIPMVGADVDTDEELCNRWMQLFAFMPFYRNHNTYGAFPQGPYPSCIAIAARYALLPYWVGIFLGRGSVIWREWYTHAVVNAMSRGNITLDAPISHINVHTRDNSALLLHQEPGYTIYETREGPYVLLVSLNVAGTAFGTAYMDNDTSFQGMLKN